MLAEKYGEQAGGLWTDCLIIAECSLSHPC